jgi:hypothetical protein
VLFLIAVLTFSPIKMRQRNQRELPKLTNQGRSHAKAQVNRRTCRTRVQTAKLDIRFVFTPPTAQLDAQSGRTEKQLNLGEQLLLAPITCVVESAN